MTAQLSNDQTRLVPRTEFPQGRVLEFDFPGLEIGVAEYDEGPTGCTVFHLPKVASLSIDVRGGSPGVNGQHLDAINAICFAGGSLYGLEASTGVAAELFKRRSYSTSWMDIALVSGAIIFDYGTRGNAIYPDKELGRAAVHAMRPGRFLLGARGAGRSATASHGAGAELAGQGGAYRESGPTKILAFVVVNAYGCIVDRTGKVVRGARITGGPNETFGVSTVVVRYSGAKSWDRLVAVLTVGGTPITAGGIKINATTGTATIKLMNQALRVAAGKKLTLYLGSTSLTQSSANALYLAAVTPDAQITIGRVRLNVSKLKQAVSK